MYLFPTFPQYELIFIINYKRMNQRNIDKLIYFIFDWFPFEIIDIQTNIVNIFVFIVKIDAGIHTYNDCFNIVYEIHWLIVMLAQLNARLSNI